MVVPVVVGVVAELVVADGQTPRDLVHVVVHQLPVGIVVVFVVIVTFISKTLWPESRWVLGTKTKLLWGVQFIFSSNAEISELQDLHVVGTS